jgi:4-hydroxybenzoate polyprenyltransferase
MSERFPIVKHGVIIAIFTFSAIGYSRILSDKTSFIPWFQYLLGFIIVFNSFLLLRISDEFKDIEEDRKYRPYLPVPRGLVSLKELALLGVILLLINSLIIAFFQYQLLFIYLGVLLLLVLMRYEFFLGGVLSKNRVIYTLSHMFIIPALDLYASALDWELEGTGFHNALLWFLLVSYFNGVVLEFGRKITSKENEETGVPTYSKIFGEKGAAIVWICSMLLTMSFALFAANAASFSLIGHLLLVVFFLICAIPGILFFKHSNHKNAKRIEVFSGVWTALMYLHLGGFPIIYTLLS